MRKQYHFRTIGQDVYVWDVHKLVRAAASLTAISVPLSAMTELDENWWYKDTTELPTPRSIAEHMSLVQQADLAYPILLCADGRLMDGMHRVVKALLQQQTHIQAICFPVTPEPDYINVDADELSYLDEDI